MNDGGNLPYNIGKAITIHIKGNKNTGVKLV